MVSGLRISDTAPVLVAQQVCLEKSQFSTMAFEHEMPVKAALRVEMNTKGPDQSCDECVPLSDIRLRREFLQRSKAFEIPRKCLVIIDGNVFGVWIGSEEGTRCLSNAGNPVFLH